MTPENARCVGRPAYRPDRADDRPRTNPLSFPSRNDVSPVSSAFDDRITATLTGSTPEWEAPADPTTGSDRLRAPRAGRQ